MPPHKSHTAVGSMSSVSNSARLAVCLTGQARSFIYLIARERIHRLLTLLSRVTLFVVLEAHDSRASVTLQHMLEPFKPIWMDLRLAPKHLEPMNSQCHSWGTPKITTVLEKPVRGGIPNVYSMYRPANGSSETILQRWMQVSEKLSSCYDAVEMHERASGRAFAFIMRLRPDILFLWPDDDALKPLQEAISSFHNISNTGISGPQSLRAPLDLRSPKLDFRASAQNFTCLVPVGMAGARMNDHIVVCTRDAAWAYFKGSYSEYMNCTGSFKEQYGYQWQGWGTLQAPLVSKLWHAGVRIVPVPIFYTVLRERATCAVNGDTFECNKLGKYSHHQIETQLNDREGNRFQLAMAECKNLTSKTCSGAPPTKISVELTRNESILKAQRQRYAEIKKQTQRKAVGSTTWPSPPQKGRIR